MTPEITIITVIIGLAVLLVILVFIAHRFSKKHNHPKNIQRDFYDRIKVKDDSITFGEDVNEIKN